MGIIFIIGSVQAFFIEFILLNKKNKAFADKVLAVWMFFIGVHLFLYYLYHIEIYLEWPYMMGIMAPLPLVHGPFLLMYVISLIKPEKKVSRWNLLHFVLAVSFFLILAPKFFLNKDDLLTFIELTDTATPVEIIVFAILIDISGLVYVPWSILLLRRHKKSIGNNFSYTESINLLWLRNLIYGMAAIWTAVITARLLENYLPLEGFDYSVIIYLTVTVFTFFIGYFGAKQNAIFADNTETESTEEKTPQQNKYKKSALKKEQSDSYLEILLAHMEQEKPYLESKITLPQLAEQLDIHYNYLSQTINEQLNQNFYEFINSYRVEEFKKRMTDGDAQKLTLLGHAYESGFSSKSSFNEVFKKMTGSTPSQYSKQSINN